MTQRKSRKYFTLLVLDLESDTWTPEFGDYVYSCVVGEMQLEYRDKGVSKRCLTIIQTLDDQASVTEAVNRFNHTHRLGR